MSNRVFGTEKVDNIIGLKDQKVYDKIDIFVDITNNNNVWGLIYYTDYKNHKPMVKQEIVRFQDNESMLEYVRSNFDGYELNHPIDANHKKIFFHYVDYCDINYYYHEGKPKLNYVVLKINEYANNTRIANSIKFPKEYEDILLQVFKVSKKMPTRLGPTYHNDVDVYWERTKNRRELVRAITISIGEFFSYAGDKIKTISKNKKLIKSIKIFVAASALTTLLGGGYKLVTDNIYNSEYLEQHNPISSIQDIGTYVNKGKTGIIIDKLMDEKYSDVKPEEINETLNFIKNIENSNYDNNASYNMFSYKEYFKDKVFLSDEDGYMYSSEVLEKIDRLYKRVIYVSKGKTIINKDAANEYLDYVCSLTFMYDAYHSERGFTHYQDGNNQSIMSPYATSSEIKAYDKFPSVLKYIILNQMDTLLRKVNYKVDVKPTYFFKSTDKYSLLSEIEKRMDSVIDSMYFECGYNSGKTM